MEKNFRKFLIKIVIFVAVIYLTRVIFNFPIEYWNIKWLKQSAVNRLFSKFDALQVVSLVSIFFGLYFRHRIAEIEHPKVNWKKAIGYLLAAEAAVAAYYLVRSLSNILSISEGPLLFFLQLGILTCLGIAAVLFALAVFGKSYLLHFMKEFRKELLIALGVTILLYNLLMYFQSQWPFFSGAVSVILYSILSQFYLVTYSMSSGAPILTINDFSVSIGAPCSGIDSMLLFFAFFSALFALDHKRLRKKLYIILFLIGLLGTYVVNLVRLYLLIIMGVHISPRFAVGLFHTNAGWLLFVIYCVCYYWLIKRFIYKTKSSG
jgi:exosortase/archaeosortase family protein